MVQDTKKCTWHEAKRFIALKKEDGGLSFKERMAAIRASKAAQEFTPFPVDVIEKNAAALWEPENEHALHYLRFDRGFSEKTLRKFNIGYSEKQGLITVPMYEPRGRFPIGVIGRSASDEVKVFKNSLNLPKARTIWNIHEARKHETLIVTEASFDGMSIDQAGYANVGALLGGTLSDEQEMMIRRHFSKVIIMTDNDPKQYNEVCRKCMRKGFQICQGHSPGRDLGMTIAQRLSGLGIYWGAYSDTEIFARGVKDANKMTGDEIRQTIRNAITHYEYMQWQVE